MGQVLCTAGTAVQAPSLPQPRAISPEILPLHSPSFSSLLVILQSNLRGRSADRGMLMRLWPEGRAAASSGHLRCRPRTPAGPTGRSLYPHQSTDKRRFIRHRTGAAFEWTPQPRNRHQWNGQPPTYGTASQLRHSLPLPLGCRPCQAPASPEPLAAAYRAGYGQHLPYTDSTTTTEACLMATGVSPRTTDTNAPRPSARPGLPHVPPPARRGRSRGSGQDGGEARRRAGPPLGSGAGGRGAACAERRITARPIALLPFPPAPPPLGRGTGDVSQC